MILKEKSFLWYFTFPFAHNNYTTIGDTLYYPKDSYPSALIIAHEQIHSRQQKDEGIIKFLFLYLFVLPLFWNPWRFKWEYEAYKNGSKWSDQSIREELSSMAYGWLFN